MEVSNLITSTEILILSFFTQTLCVLFFVWYIQFATKVINDVTFERNASKKRRLLIGLGAPSLCIVTEILASLVSPIPWWSKLIGPVIMIFVFIIIVIVLKNQSFFSSQRYSMETTMTD